MRYWQAKLRFDYTLFLTFSIYQTMKKSTQFSAHRLFGGLLVALGIAYAAPALAQTPVAKYGALQVKGSQIQDQSGKPVSLTGNSLF